MSFLTPSVHDQSYFFPPVHLPPPKPSSSTSASTTEHASSDPRPQHPMATPHLHKLSNFVNLLKRSTGATIALCWGAIRIAAVVEDQSVVPPLVDLGKGVVGVVCAGGLVWGVVALGDTAEGSDRVDVEGKWRAVWRWWRDRAGRGGGERRGQMEMEGTMTFTAEGESVFLQDEPEAGRPRIPPPRAQTPQPAIPRRSSDERQTQTRPTLPTLAFPLTQNANSVEAEQPIIPPSQTQSTERFLSFEDICSSNSSPSRRGRDATSTYTSKTSSHPNIHQANLRHRPKPHTSHLFDEHLSGLLGPSPMPSRYWASKGWKHFTGTGFYKHQQKLEGVSEWSNPGSSRSLEEVMRSVEELGERGKWEEDGRDKQGDVLNEFELRC